jgi:hypothetical protein
MNPATSPRLKLPTAPETAVFRAILAQLQRDPTLSRVIPPDNWHTYNGDPRSKRPPAHVGPEIWIWPTGGPSAWWTEGAQLTPLFLNVEYVVPSNCVDDAVNIWHALRKALYSGAPAEDIPFYQVLIGAGAVTGLTAFSLGGFDANPEEAGELYRANGQMRIDIRIDT